MGGRRARRRRGGGGAALGARAGGGPSQRALEERATAFRYERGLLSADETAAWFEIWGIPLAAWLRHERGKLLAEAGTHAPHEEPAPGAAWIESVLSGTLERVAHRLAAALAVLAAVGCERTAQLSELEAAMDEFARTAATPEGLNRVIMDHRLAWTTLDLAAVDLPEAGAARELLYCVREDRRSIRDVAADAGVTLKLIRTTLDALPAEVVTQLSSAFTGDVLGPLPCDSDWRVVSVLARREPDAGEPRTAARARKQLVTEAIAREAARRVRWLDPMAAPRS